MKSSLEYWPNGRKPNLAHALRVWIRACLAVLVLFLAVPWLAPIFAPMSRPGRQVSYEDLLNPWLWAGVLAAYAVCCLLTLIGLLFQYRSRARSWKSRERRS